MKTELTNMCMVCSGGKILVQNRVDPVWPGITLPGGHVEPGESFAQAVIREVYEETGLTISNPLLCGVKQWVYNDGFRSISFLYRADRFSGKMHTSEEGDVFCADKNQLFNMELASGMAETLRIFFDSDLSELAYFRTDKEALGKEWHYADWSFQLS